MIGNPPYGAKTKDTEKVLYKQYYEAAISIKGLQKGSTDTFTIFVNQGFHLLCKNGVLSFIVPMAVTSSDSMTALHNLLEKNCETMKISSYSNRPKQIFDAACIRTSIIMFQKTFTSCKHVYTSKLVRRSENASIQYLISNLKFVDSYKYKLSGRYAKIGTEQELQILSKIFATGKKIEDYKTEKGNAFYYRAAGGRYFNVVTNYPTKSSAEKSVVCKYNDVIGLILSSSLFWFYQQVYTDGLNLKSYEIDKFPLPNIEKIKNIEELKKIYEQYLQDIENNAIIQKSSGKSTYNISSFKVYRLRKSKAIIDCIDDLICPLYGLTKEETEFIKNYETEYRSSDEE